MSRDLKYYNYISFYRGIVVYVGKGVGKRYEHTITGQSGNELINDFYFRNKYLGDMPLDTYIVKRYNTDVEACKGEEKLISKYLPYCNKCSGREHKDTYSFKEKLTSLCEELGYDHPETLYSKFDFKFLFTPKGLLCTSVSLSENSPFEKTGERFHVRLKSEFHKYFPENILQFIKHDRDTHGVMLTSFCTKYLYMKIFKHQPEILDYLRFSPEWKASAILSDCWDFAEPFGFKFESLAYEELVPLFSKFDSHVMCYTKHNEEVKLLEQKATKDAKIQLRKRIQEESKFRSSFKHKFVRVKKSDNVLDKLSILGYDISGVGEWVNISFDIKPHISLSPKSKYKVYKEDDFLNLPLDKFRKK